MDFRRTLQTAEEADGIARLLLRVAAADRKSPVTNVEAERLQALSERYRDYAASLRETADASKWALHEGDDKMFAEPAADQMALL